MAVRLQGWRNEWEAVKAFKASGSRVGRERVKVLTGAIVIGMESFFFFHKMTQIPSGHTLFQSLNFPCYIIMKFKSNTAQRPCLIKLLPTSAACIFVLSSPSAVLVLPQVLHTCCFFWLENVLALIACLTLLSCRFQCKIMYHRDPFSSYCPPPLLYSKLRHLSRSA